MSKRLDQVDGELKLIKNEIKQVLLDIQEQVLTIQNPFTALAASVNAPRPMVSNEVEAPSSGGGGPPSPAPPAMPAAPPMPVPSAPVFTPPAVAPQYGPVYYDPGPISPPPGRRRGRETGGEPLEEDFGPDDGPEETSARASDDGDTVEGPAARQRPRRGRRKEVSGQSTPRRTGREIPDREMDEPVEEESRTTYRPGLDKTGAPAAVDLVTLAGLAAWTDQAVSKIGRE